MKPGQVYPVPGPSAVQALGIQGMSPQQIALQQGLGAQNQQFGMGLPQQLMAQQQAINAQHKALMETQLQQMLEDMQNAVYSWSKVGRLGFVDPEDPDYRAARDLINETISHYNQEDEDV